MKLKNWLEKCGCLFPAWEEKGNGKDIKVWLARLLATYEKFHVIGTCTMCKYALLSTALKDGDIHCSKHNNIYDYDFGCIHFEEKGEK